MKRVALATCREVPELDPDDRPLVPVLAAFGVEAVPAVWDDPAEEWATYDLVVLRSTWDYAERRAEFLAWTRSLARVVNEVPLLEWNTDKERYIGDLAEAGVPCVHTRFVPPGELLEPQSQPFVIKPTVSAGGRYSARFTPEESRAASNLVKRIHAEGRTAMVQPYLVDTEERALVYIEGVYSHSLRRRVPLPSGGDHSVLYLDEDLTHAAATHQERETADAAIACIPGQPLYARVDLLGGAVLELEATEPSLYLSFGPGAVERFAAAIAARLG